MSPTIVLDDGAPFLAVGTPGGSTIITTVAEILFNRIDRGMSLPEAIAAPRATQRNTSTVGAEPEYRALYEAGLDCAGPRVQRPRRDRRGDGHRVPARRPIPGSRRAGPTWWRRRRGGETAACRRGHRLWSPALRCRRPGPGLRRSRQGRKAPWCTGWRPPRIGYLVRRCRRPPHHRRLPALLDLTLTIAATSIAALLLRTEDATTGGAANPTIGSSLTADLVRLGGGIGVCGVGWWGRGVCRSRGSRCGGGTSTSWRGCRIRDRRRVRGGGCGGLRGDTSNGTRR